MSHNLNIKSEYISANHQGGCMKDAQIQVAARELLDAADLVAQAGAPQNAALIQSWAADPQAHKDEIITQIEIEESNDCDTNQALVKRFRNALSAIEKSQA